MAWGWRDLVTSDGQRDSTAFCDYYRDGIFPSAMYRTPGTCGLCVRRDVFEELGGFDEQIPRMDDFDFTFRFFQRPTPRFHVIEEVVLYYHFEGGNHISSDGRKTLMAQRYLLGKHRDFFESYPKHLAQRLAQLSLLSSTHGSSKLDAVRYLWDSLRVHRRPLPQQLTAAAALLPGSHRIARLTIVRALRQRLGSRWKQQNELHLGRLKTTRPSKMSELGL